MRVISLVPSWTETLVEAGVFVVGRTRFCIHPSDRVKTIQVVGGTKDLKLEEVRALAPDLILLDREENTLEMAEALKAIAPLHVSHVRHVREMPSELRALAAALAGSGGVGGEGASSRAVGVAKTDALQSVLSELEKYAVRFEAVFRAHETRSGLSESRESRTTSSADSGPASVPFCYAIWKDPWMCVSKNTFIASMLEQAGWDLTKLWSPELAEDAFENSSASNYPKFDLSDLPQGAHLLLSSEPFPFAKKIEDVKSLLKSEALRSKQLTYELIDGESYSWFGLRALRFLESLG